MCAGKTYVNLCTQLVAYLWRVPVYKENMLGCGGTVPVPVLVLAL